MPHPARVALLTVSTSSAAAVALLGGTSAFAQVQTPASTGDRVLGLDISAWQGNISQTTWNNIRNVEDRQFVFIRSSRGGTTGYYDQTDADNSNGLNTLSQRYDDPYFVQNINRATTAGMLAGPYHFGRMDIIASTPNSGGIANTGTDEANHFLEMAGSWMRPGYLLPVFDLEAGASQRSTASMSQFAREFSDRIFAVKGIRPIVYISSSYATNEVDATVPAYFPNLWIARWPNQANPDAIDVQNIDPPAASGFPNVYGQWNPSYPNTPNPHPWMFWQYASTGRLASFNSGNSNLDFDVAHGNIEYVKDMQVPALWTSATNGTWSTLLNWNSGQTPAPPVYGPGQVTPVGTQTLPTARLPGAQDNVDLERPNENVTVTLNTAATVRRIDVNERLNVVGGGALSAGLTGQVGNGGTLSLSGGGTATFTQGYVNGTGALEFTGNGTLAVEKLFLANNGGTFNGASGTGQIVAKAGAVNPALDLTGGTRQFNVNDGSAATDMRIALPLSNGNLTKTGAGTLELTGNNSAFAGDLFVTGGNLRLTATNQIGTAGVRTGPSGSVQIDGNGLNFTRQLVLGGLGAGSGGALQNFSGNNTWSGNVVLNGANNNQGQTGLNQISAADGTTLTLSGVIQNGGGGSWAKIGAGDVVLRDADPNPSPNTYSNLTRLFGGRIIIEKDAALGATNPLDAGASTLQRAGDATAIAFRAPAGSAGLNYAAQEWIFTEGSGVNGAQIDNLAGANTFAGHFGLGGPLAGGVQQASFGVAAGSSLELTGGLHARNLGAATDPVRVDVAKRGNGTLILSGTNAGGPTNTFARALADGSTFTIEAGTVRLKGIAGNGENVAGVNAWMVNAGATLSLAQGGAAGDAAVRLAGGTLRAEQSLIAANALAFTGNGTLDAGAAVSARFGGNVTGSGGLTKSGAGNVFLGGAVNGFGGAVNVTGGTLGVAPDGTDSRVGNFNGLSIAAAARFDLADNDLIIRVTPPASVEQLARNGYADGAWDGLGGINSSTAEGIHTLGVADNARLNLSSFGGHTGLTGAETLVKYTYYGDADLTGFVDRADFLRFRDGFFDVEAAAWLFGDFNYSGDVNAGDWALFLYGFRNQPGTPPWGSFHEELLTFANENGLDPTLVPEPASAALLALGAGLLLRRRRRAS